jgi:voltage-gated potassium channel
VNQAQRSQRLDQGQLTPVKWPELFVAVNERAELPVLLSTLAAEQHPEVLHRRPRSGVVEIDKVGARTGMPLGCPKDVARVAIAVQAQRLNALRVSRFKPVQTRMSLNQRQRLTKGFAPSGTHLGGHHVVQQKPVARFVGESGGREGRAFGERLLGAHGVDARQEPTDPLQYLEIVQLGAAPPAPRTHGKRKTGEVVQCRAVKLKRRHHGNLGSGQCVRKGVFLLNLGIAPALGTVELDHHLLMPFTGGFQVHLVYPVLKTVERGQPPITPKTHAGQGILHHIGRQGGIGVLARRADFIHPAIVAARACQNPGMNRAKAQRRHLVRRGLWYSLGLCVMILLLGGVGFWALEPEINTLQDGLWLAFTTAATVGYGDTVPQTHVGRVFAVVVVLLGLAVLSLVTASLAALFVEQDVQADERQIEVDLLREIRALRHQVNALERRLNPDAPEAPNPTSEKTPL